MPSVDKDTRVLKDPVTGALISVPAAEADARAAAEGLEYASLSEVRTANDREKYGTGGQTALAAGELALETATLGIVRSDSEDAKNRRELLRRDSPVLAFGADLAGVAPGVAAAALTGGAAGAVGLGARAAAIASAVAEGGVSGYAQEQVQAREEGRDVDIGNVLLYGVGGEIAGRLIPKAMGSGLNKVADALTPARALADEADNVLVRAEQRAAQSSTDIAEALPGPERDRFLRDNAKDLTNEAAERARKGLDASNARFHDLGDLSKKRAKIAALVSKEHAGQDQWMADQLENLQGMRAEMEGAPPPAAARPAPDLTPEEAEALNAGKSSIGLIRRPKGKYKAALESALQKTAQDDPGVLYRGMGLKQEQLDSIMSGGYTIDQLTPATPQRASAEAFTSHGKGEGSVPVLMELNGTTKAHVAHGYAGDAFEAEATTFLPPGQKYKVVGVEDIDIPGAGKGKLLRLESELPQPKAPKRGSNLGEVQGLKGMVSKLGAFLDDAEQKLTSSRKAADRFIEADQVKRGLQKFHVSLAKSRMSALDPAYHDQLTSIVDAVQENMRRGLEDESIWGRAARFQADVNSAWHNRWFRGAPVAEGDLARITGRDFDAKSITEFDPAKIRSFLEKDKVGRGLTEEKLNDMLDGYQEMAEAHRKWGITDEAELDKLQRDVADVRLTLEEADEIQGSVPRADAADKAESAMDSLISQGLPVVGSAYVGMKRALRNVNTAGKGHVRSSMNVMVNGVRRVGKGLDKASKRGGGAVGVVAAGHLRERQTNDARFQGDHPTMQQAFMARRAQITTALQEPEQLAAAMADSFGDLPDQFPDVHFRLSERFTQAFMYLGDNLPPGIENSLLSQHSLPPDLRSIREFAKLWEAVMDPGAVVADFASMNATPKQARAIEAVHPDLWAQMQTDTLEAVANSPNRPSWERMRYVAQIFKLGGALGGVWKPNVAKNIRNSLKTAPVASMDRPATPLPTGPGNPRGIATITNGPTSGSA